MAEYIERETLFEEIRKEFRPYWQIPCDYEDKVTQKMVAKMRGLIDKLPSADVVEVIRCKDCKFWDAVRNTKYKGTGICKPPNLSLKGGYCVRRGATLENDYCSGAKRKDGDAK